MTELRDVPIEVDATEGDDWGEWLRVEFHIEALLQTCRSQAVELILTCEPPDRYVAKCQIGKTQKGVEAIFVMQNTKASNGPWAVANRVDDYWILQSPITAAAVGAAARLLMTALRSQGAGPTDVYPSYVLRDFVGEF